MLALLTRCWGGGDGLRFVWVWLVLSFGLLAHFVLLVIIPGTSK